MDISSFLIGQTSETVSTKSAANRAVAAANSAEESAIAAAASAAAAQVQVGLPYKIASSSSNMVDHDIGYLYTGNEEGYIYGAWYYWDGTNWTLGGTATDSTFLIEGVPADSKAAGDKFSEEAQKAEKLAANAYPTITVQGDIANTTLGADNVLIKSAIMYIEPVQEGSGDPSPTNIRPINGWTAANIIVSPTQSILDGTTYSVDWESKKGTIYRGFLNTETGLLTITGEKVLISELTWSAQGNDIYRTSFNSNILYDTTVRPNVICSIFRTVSRYNFVNYNPKNAFSVYNPSSNNYLYVRVEGCDNNATTFKSTYGNAYFINDKKEDRYETVQLTPIQIKSLLGQNNVWANCGDISVTFHCDPNLYIDYKINEAISQL